MIKIALAVISALVLSWTANAGDLSQHSTDAQKTQARAIVNDLQPKVDQLHQSYQADLNGVTPDLLKKYCGGFKQGFYDTVTKQGYRYDTMVKLGFTCDKTDVLNGSGDLNQAYNNGANNADWYINKADNAGVK